MSNEQLKVEKPLVEKKVAIEKVISSLFDHWDEQDNLCHKIGDQCYTCDEFLNSIVAWGPVALGPLMQKYRNGPFNDFIRRRFVFLIGKLGNPEALDFLVENLKDPDLGVHLSTISSLGLINNPQALPVLTEVLLQDENKYARWHAVEAIANLDLYANIELFLSAFKDTDADVRNVAIKVLGVTSDSRAIASLEQIINYDEGKDWLGNSLKATARDAIKLIEGQLAGTIVLPKIKYYTDLIKLVALKGFYLPENSTKT